MGGARPARRRLPDLRPPRLDRADLQPHLAARAGRDEHYLINPFGLHYSEVCASNLVKVDLAGNIVGHSDWPINPAGITFHGAIHATLPDAHCVMHLHTTATQAVCCLKDGLAFTNFYAAQLYGKVAYHDFEGITVHADEGARILKSAEGRPVLLLRNHGPVTIGADPAAGALADVDWSTAPARSSWRRRAMGEAIADSRAPCSRIASPTRCSSTRSTAPAKTRSPRLQRLVDRKDPSYRM